MIEDNAAPIPTVWPASFPDDMGSIASAYGMSPDFIERLMGMTFTLIILGGSSPVATAKGMRVLLPDAPISKLFATAKALPMAWKEDGSRVYLEAYQKDLAKYGIASEIIPDSEVEAKYPGIQYGL